MPVSLKTLSKDWAKVDAKKAKTASDPITKFVTTFTTVMREYDRARFVDGVSGNNAKSDTDRYIKAFDDYTTKVVALAKTPNLSPKEKTFLDDTHKAVKAEHDFWKTRPIENNLPIVIEKDLRKSWSERKKQAEEAFTKSHPGGEKFPVKFDEGFGPALEKLEKASKLKDQQALAGKLDKVVKSYGKALNDNKAALGEIPYDLLFKQLVRIDTAVKKIEHGA